MVRTLDAIAKREEIRSPSDKLKKVPKKVLFWLMALVFSGAVIFAANEINTLLALAKLLGSGKYLVLFQNNTELRPTGGFIGSIGELTTKNGRLIGFDIEGNIYDKDDAFSAANFIPPPEPYKKFWPDRGMVLSTSNWSPDFPESAKSAQWFYEKEYGKTVDGVIAVNATVVPYILKIIGSINIDAPKMTLAAENFLGTIQQYVEQDYYKKIANQNENKPKAILKDVFGAVVEKIKFPQAVKLALIADELLARHEIQLYFNNVGKQKIVSANNWAVFLDQPGKDYLYVNNANLGGGKGSLAVAQRIRYETKQKSDGRQEATVTIQRTNSGRQDFPVGENFNYTRVILPIEARLEYVNLEGKPVENLVVSEDYGRRVVGFWFSTPVNQIREAVVVYSLPKAVGRKLFVQTQPGAINQSLKLFVNGAKMFNGELRQSKSFVIM